MDKPLKMAPRDDARKALAAWFRSALGEQVFATEQALHDELLEDTVGYHLLQISAQNQALFAKSPIPHKRRLAESFGLDPDLIASPLQMPILTDQVDVVLLHHLLEFVDRPQALLTESARVVMPQGLLMITGFNPFSFWGMKALLSRESAAFPFKGRFLSAPKLMDWLNILNFKIDRVLYAEFGLPMLMPWVRPPNFGLGLGRRYNLMFGGVYMIIARKYVAPLTPVRGFRQRRLIRFSDLGLSDSVPGGLTPSRTVSLSELRFE